MKIKCKRKHLIQSLIKYVGILKVFFQYIWRFTKKIFIWYEILTEKSGAIPQNIDYLGIAALYMYPLAGLVNIFTYSQFIRDSASVTSLHYRAHVLKFSATNLTWQLILYLF